MKFRADEIHNLLKAHAGKDPGVDDGPPTCDVVYAVFLEPAPDTDPRLSTLECVIDKAVLGTRATIPIGKLLVIDADSGVQNVDDDTLARHATESEPQISRRSVI